MSNLAEHGSSKLESRDLDRKLKNIQEKGYADLITKLQANIETLKVENQRLMVDYQNKAAKHQNR